MSLIGDDPMSRLYPHSNMTNLRSLVLSFRRLLDLWNRCFPCHWSDIFLFEFITLIPSCRGGGFIDFIAAATRWLQKSSRKFVLFYFINFQLTFISLNPTFMLKTVSSCIKTTFHTHTPKFTEILVCVSYFRPFADSPADDRSSSVWLTVSRHRPESPSKTTKRIIVIPLAQPARMAADYKLISWVALY